MRAIASVAVGRASSRAALAKRLSRRWAILRLRSVAVIVGRPLALRRRILSLAAAWRRALRRTVRALTALRTRKLVAALATATIPGSVRVGVLHITEALLRHGPRAHAPVHGWPRGVRGGGLAVPLTTGARGLPLLGHPLLQHGVRRPSRPAEGLCLRGSLLLRRRSVHVSRGGGLLTLESSGIL